MGGSFFHSMSKNTKKVNKTKIITAAVVTAVLLILAYLLLTGNYRCPFKFITGIPCPACGLTRACVSLTFGDIQGAFHYHPLWPVVVPTVLVELLNGFGLIKLPKKFNNIWLCIVGGLLLVCYIVRLATNTIVY